MPSYQCCQAVKNETMDKQTSLFKEKEMDFSQENQENRLDSTAISIYRYKLDSLKEKLVTGRLIMSNRLSHCHTTVLFLECLQAHNFISFNVIHPTRLSEPFPRQ